MNKKWIVQAALAAVGVLGAYDLAAAPGEWLRVFAEHPWIGVVLTFGGGVGATLTLQDIWRSRLAHRSVHWLADSAWAVRQFFSGNIQSGHVRAYYVTGPDGEEQTAIGPPDSAHDARAGSCPAARRCPRVVSPCGDQHHPIKPYGGL